MKKLNNKGFGIPELLIIILALVLIGGATIYVIKSSQKDESATDNQQEQPDVKTTANSEEITPINSKFTHKDVEFSVIKYDPNPVLKGKSPPNGSKYVAVYLRAHSHAKSSDFIPHELLMKINGNYQDEALKLGLGFFTGKDLPDSQIDLELQNTSQSHFDATFIEPEQIMEGYLIYETPANPIGKPLLSITNGEKTILNNFALE